MAARSTPRESLTDHDLLQRLDEKFDGMVGTQLAMQQTLNSNNLTYVSRDALANVVGGLNRDREDLADRVKVLEDTRKSERKELRDFVRNVALAVVTAVIGIVGAVVAHLGGRV